MAVSHFEVKRLRGVALVDDDPGVGAHTRVLCRCRKCGQDFVYTLRGRWTKEQLEAEV